MFYSWYLFSLLFARYFYVLVNKNFSTYITFSRKLEEETDRWLSGNSKLGTCNPQFDALANEPPMAKFKEQNVTCILWEFMAMKHPVKWEGGWATKWFIWGWDVGYPLKGRVDWRTGEIKCYVWRRTIYVV